MGRDRQPFDGCLRRPTHFRVRLGRRFPGGKGRRPVTEQFVLAGQAPVDIGLVGAGGQLTKAGDGQSSVAGQLGAAGQPVDHLEAIALRRRGRPVLQRHPEEAGGVPVRVDRFVLGRGGQQRGPGLLEIPAGE